MTSPALYRLVYYSRNVIADTDIAAEIEAILHASQRNNAAIEVTGALIFNNGIFAQVLEGQRTDIETTFERIQRDARHSDVQMLMFEMVAHRRFPNWSMGHVGRNVRDRRLFDWVGVASGFDQKQLAGERVLAIMVEIAQDEERCAA